MKSRAIFLLVFLVATVVGLGWTTGQRQWEYQQTCTAKDLNTLGANGWELVSASSLTTDVTCFYLKRPK
jgi:hypothetical protein